MDATFSLDLSEEVVQVRDWVHEFAESVIRPAAAEWDEREETPWPIIQEAAKVGLYTPDLFAQMAGEASGLGMPTVFEEMFWGDAGIALSIMATGLAAAALAANGTPQQIGEWLPQMFGSPGDPQLAAFCSSEPGAGSDVGAVRTRARYDEAADEWVLNGTKTWATNGGIANVHVVVASVEPELGTRGQATFIVPPGTKGLSQGQKFKKHGIRASHTAEVVLDDVRLPGELILGGREKFERRIAKIREGHRTSSQAAMMTFERTRPTVGAMALGIARAAYEYALDYSLSARAVRPQDRRIPGYRFQIGRHEEPHRRIPDAGVAGQLDAAQQQAVHLSRGFDGEALRQRDRGVRHRRSHPDPRRQRLHARLPGRANAPGCKDFHHL